MNSADPSILSGITFTVAVPTLVLLALFHRHSPFNFWSPVVEKYATLTNAEHFDCTWQSLGVGCMHFGGIVKAAFMPQGLFLTLSFPFGLFQKPVLIPWHDIHIISAHRFGGTVSIGRPEIAKARLSKELFKGIQQHKGKP